MIAAAVLLALLGSFGVFRLAAAGKIDIGRWLAPCGFKQRYGLPCVTCGMTTTALAFSQGRIFDAFYIQPAGALLCCLMVAIAVICFPLAVFGVGMRFVRRFFEQVKTRHIVLALIVVLAAGWAVTLARALAARN
ncbi:MAG: DUF2752 domain-containing protein [Phycisphaerales bacterium]|nr:MAG: DUF2752 domain-containing protein [Phycisphaerales bacterium]